MAYNLSKLQAQLASAEGERAYPYVDTVGKITIGIGHNLTDKGISKAVQMQMLMEDIQDAETTLTKLVPGWATLDEARQNALVELAFNMDHRLAGFPHFLAAVNSGDWGRAADELQDSLWFKQTKRRGPRVVGVIRTGQD